MIKLVTPESRASLIETLKERDLVISDDGRLFWVGFISALRMSSINQRVDVTAHAEWSFRDSCWYRTPPGTKIPVLFAIADTEEEAKDFAETVKEYAEIKQQEIDRLELQFMVSVRMLADEIV